MKKETLLYLKSEVQKIIKDKKLFDVVVDPTKPGVTSHCIYCPCCGYLDIFIIASKMEENGDVIESKIGYKIPKDPFAKSECSGYKTGKESILVDFSLLL